MPTTYKIPDLDELTSGSEATTDVLEVTDISADQSKKWTLASLKTWALGIITQVSTKMGINEASPDAPLHVTGDGTTGALGAGSELVQVFEGSLPEIRLKDMFGGGSGVDGWSIIKYNNTLYFTRVSNAGAFEAYNGQIDVQEGRWRFGDGSAPTATVDIKGSTTSYASLRIREGVAPTSPNHGDIWQDGTDLLVRINGTTYTLDKTSV